MTSPEFSGTDWYTLSSFQSGLVVSLSLAGALAGSVGALLWGDALGRRRELLIASTLYTAGALGVGTRPLAPHRFCRSGPLRRWHWLCHARCACVYR